MEVEATGIEPAFSRLKAGCKTNVCYTSGLKLRMKLMPMNDCITQTQTRVLCITTNLATSTTKIRLIFPDRVLGAVFADDLQKRSDNDLRVVITNQYVHSPAENRTRVAEI